MPIALPNALAAWYARKLAYELVCDRVGQVSWPDGPGPKVVGGGVFRCCVPWCRARAAGPADDDGAHDALRGTSDPENCGKFTLFDQLEPWRYECFLSCWERPRPWTTGFKAALLRYIGRLSHSIKLSEINAVISWKTTVTVTQHNLLR